MSKETLSYYKPINTPVGMLSCDNVRLTGELHKSTKELLNNFTSSVRPEVTLYPPSHKRGSYVHLFTIEYAKNATATIGIGLNGAGTHEDEVKAMIDFNPNKVGAYDQFWRDYGVFKTATGLHGVKRIDVALDLPYERENVLMCKDKRFYRLDMYDSSNKTEYLGRRSNPGYVKVYNKQVESDLPFPLTRVEVTTEFSVAKYQSYFPDLYILKPSQLDVETLQKEMRCHGPMRVMIHALGELIALHRNPLPLLNDLQDAQKKKALELLPLEPFQPLSYARVYELFATVSDYLGVSL